MEIKFFAAMDTIPKGTHQQRGVRVVNGRPMFYTKKTVQDQMNFYGAILRMHRPDQPIEGAVRVEIGFCYPARRKKDIGAPKVTRPDLDNMAKSIIDAAMAVGYFKDDSQICELHLSKIYSDVSGVFFYCSTIEEVDDEEVDCNHSNL
jgi:Holliday junction resolvase RusA-like endonuclease